MNSKYLKLLVLFFLLIIAYVLLFLNVNRETESLIITDYQFNDTLNIKEICTFYKCIDSYIVEKYEFSIKISQKIEYFVNNQTNITDSFQFSELKNSLARNHRLIIDSGNHSVIIPNIDLLVANDNFPTIIDFLHRWESERNILIFNFISNENHLKLMRKNPYKMIFASSSLFYPYYRSNIDVSIPFFNPMISFYETKKTREYFLYIMQKSATKIYPELENKLLKKSDKLKFIIRDDSDQSKNKDISVKVLSSGIVEKLSIRNYNYNFEEESIYCVLFPIGLSIGYHFFNSMSRNCIPVVISDRYVLPFSDVLDWNRCAVSLRQNQVPEILDILTTISDETVSYYQQHCWHFYEQYMSTMDRLVETTLTIIEDRFYPNRARSYFRWNEPDYRAKALESRDLLSMEELVVDKIYPVSFARDLGFTTVVFIDSKCVSQAHQVEFDLFIRQLLEVSGLSHVVFVRTQATQSCFIDTDRLRLFKVTLIDISNEEERIPIRYFKWSMIETDAVLLIEWHRSSHISAAEINEGFLTWLKNKNQLVGIRYRQCLAHRNTVIKYPSEAVFLNISTLRNASDYWMTVLNSTRAAASDCWNQNLRISQLWSTVYVPSNRMISVDKSCF